MRWIVILIVSAAFWFAIFALFFANEDLVLEYRTIVGGMLFAIGFGPVLLLQNAPNRFRLTFIGVYLLGMVLGASSAALLFVPELGGFAL